MDKNNIETQEIILDKIEKINIEISKLQNTQEKLFKKYDFLLNEQLDNNKNLYKILQQLLLKDLLSSYKNEIDNFLSEKNISSKEEDSDMLFIKGGTYKPSFLNKEKKVTDLYVSKYQVTQDKWKKYMKIDPSKFKQEKRPVENITWISSLKFCNKISEHFGLQPVYKIETDKLIKIIYKTGEEINPNEADFSKTEGYRLPTEVEWEWFAKGGENKNSNFKYSGGENIEEVGWYSKNSNGHSEIVGTKKPNDLQLYDCTGNVWEWCYDTTNENILNEKSYLYEENSLSKRIRGGSWCDSEPYCLITYRASSSSYSYNIGFRIVRTVNK